MDNTDEKAVTGDESSFTPIGGSGHQVPPAVAQPATSPYVPPATAPGLTPQVPGFVPFAPRGRSPSSRPSSSRARENSLWNLENDPLVASFTQLQQQQQGQMRLQRQQENAISQRLQQNEKARLQRQQENARLQQQQQQNARYEPHESAQDAHAPPTSTDSALQYATQSAPMSGAGTTQHGVANAPAYSPHRSPYSAQYVVRDDVPSNNGSNANVASPYAASPYAASPYASPGGSNESRQQELDTFRFYNGLNRNFSPFPNAKQGVSSGVSHQVHHPTPPTRGRPKSVSSPTPIAPSYDAQLGLNTIQGQYPAYPLPFRDAPFSYQTSNPAAQPPRQPPSGAQNSGGISETLVPPRQRAASAPRHEIFEPHAAMHDYGMGSGFTPPVPHPASPSVTYISPYSIPGGALAMFARNAASSLQPSAPSAKPAPKRRRVSKKKQPAPEMSSNPYALPASWGVVQQEPIPLPWRIPDWDTEHDQDIVSTYESYKWSVYLYRLTPWITAMPEGLETAASWLNTKFPHSPDQYYISMHKTEGFIKDGDSTTFLVLHNAANPRTLEDGYVDLTCFSSTTFGFYEAEDLDLNVRAEGDDDVPEKITWKTLGPGQRAVIDDAVVKLEIEEVGKWGIEMKASERRFHRAYWLAANMRPLGGLLNRAILSAQKIKRETPDRDLGLDQSFEGSASEASPGGGGGVVISRGGRASRSGSGSTAARFKRGTGLTDGMVFGQIDDGYEEDVLDLEGLDVENDGIEISEKESKLAWKQVLEEAARVYDG